MLLKLSRAKSGDGLTGTHETIEGASLEPTKLQWAAKELGPLN